MLKYLADYTYEQKATLFHVTKFFTRLQMRCVCDAMLDTHCALLKKQLRSEIYGNTDTQYVYRAFITLFVAVIR